MSEKKPRELFKERNKRVFDAIALKESDRVPITPFATFYASRQKGMTNKEAMYEPEKFCQASFEVFSEFGWDQVPYPFAVISGSILDALGVSFLKWPGAKDEIQRLKDEQPFQYVEGEYMKADEYKEFFEDPTGFTLRKIMPRHFSRLKAFSSFPDAFSLAYGFNAILQFPAFFMMPDSQDLLNAIKESVQTLFKWMGAMSKYEKDMKKKGYPVQFFNATFAPFDGVSDVLRGMRGSMLDMYRQPENLLKLIDFFTEPAIQNAVNLKNLAPNNIVFIPLHRGADGFMSNKQFETFYWPTLSKVMEGLIKNDLIPMPFFEGSYNDRLEYLQEFAKKHKGKLIYWFDRTDIFKAKEMFGDYACIRGNIPASLLVFGPPKKVEDYVKECIEKCAEGGGYIVDGGVSGIPDEAKPENVKAMTEAVFKYGVYRK